MQNIKNGGFWTQFLAPFMFQYTDSQLWDDLLNALKLKGGGISSAPPPRTKFLAATMLETTSCTNKSILPR
jgi:hypothetical protein